MSSAYSTAVEHTPHNREVVGLNPARCGAFSLLFLSLNLSICGVSLIKSLTEVRHN